MNDDRKLTYEELEIKTKKLEEEFEKFKSERIADDDNFFQTFFTYSPSVKLIINSETGGIIKANMAACNYYGYSLAEMVNMNINQINTLPDEEIKHEILNIKTDKRNFFNFRHKLKSGEIRDVEVYSEKIVLQNNGYLYSIIRDVIKEKQDEKELSKVKEIAEETEERYKRIIKGVTDYVYTVKVKDGKAIETHHNEACIAITGYSRKEFESDPYLWINMVVPEERELVAGSFLKLLGGKDLYSIEHRIIHKNGNIRWVNDTLVPKHDSNGNLISYDGIITDITERKQAELALILRESYLSAIIENQPGLLWLKDLNGRFLAVNTKFSDVCGLDSPQSVVGKTDFDLWPKDVANKHNEYDIQVIESKKPCTVEETISYKGNTYWFETFKTPIFDKQGTVIGTTGYSHDITERKQAIEAVAKEQTLLKTLIDNLPNAVFVKDKNYRKIIANKVHLSSMALHLASLGLDSNTEIIGKSDFEVTSKEEAERYFLDDKKVIEDGQEIINKEEEGAAPDNKQTWMLISKIPLQDKNGAIIGMVGITTDITNLKQTQKLLEETNQLIEVQNEEYQQINEELLQTNDELERAKIKAEESDRLKTSFLQNMSHEIRTPMNGIMGFSELLIENFNDKTKLEGFISIINQCCNDLLDIVNEILDIAKIESGQLSVNMEECNLDELFLELTSFFEEHQKRIGKEQIKFSLQAHCPQPGITIITDKVKLKQIFLNLIGNAFKFTDSGNIEGGCQLGNEHNLIFYVSDTGVGIPPDKHNAIFERFTQLDYGINRVHGGTGLGLSIVKGLVGLLGGKIWLESEPGKGSTFFFSISYKTVQAFGINTKPIDNPGYFKFSKKTILLVEDDEHNVAYFNEIFNNTGLDIINAESGEIAVQISREKGIDLILMDIRLPDIDGYETARQIKKINPDIKIIAQTAYAGAEDKQKAFDAGFVDYISKPIKRDLLLSMLYKHLSKV